MAEETTSEGSLRPAPGRLLVARPTMVDPRFMRTVILMLEHGDDGSTGVVVNRPSETFVAEELPDWAGGVAPPDKFFVGGPVEPLAVMAVGRLDQPDDDWRDGSRLIDGTVILDMSQGPEAAETLSGHRLFVGYAGWSPGQLEGELHQEGWWVVESEPSDLFTADPAGLWSAVLRRQDGDLATVASFPEDVSLN
ncbi:MAG: YqgE/AlgH family protein [Actinomycetia bacterium]|nr:YqgE/AlgH family protein [Actinomycetes bacterium]